MNESEPVEEAMPATRLEPLCFGLCGAMVLFFLFRHFGEMPLGLFQDETSMGYSARTIGRTLADPSGATLPLFFPSLGDWLSPIPIYAMALTEVLFGATPLGVRLPSALFALGMSVGLFFLLRDLTGRPRLARWLALLSLLVPSIFFYARIGFESSCVPCMLVLALLALRAFDRDPNWRSGALAGAALGLVTYTYPTGRLLAPLLVIAAAVSFAFHPTARRHLVAFLTAAALLGAPMAVYMVAHPERLLTRLSENAAWADNAGWPTVFQRIVHTYLQHLGSVDFLFRTGQHRVWHNAGEGLLPVWLAIPLGLGLGSLWLRRKEPFPRIVLAALLLSPIPVCLTLQPDFPHTSRSLQFVPLAIIAGGLALSDFFLRQRPPRWIPVLALAGALLEGGQDLRIYFKDYAVEQERTLDDDIGPALRIVFAHRTGEESVYLPDEFFDNGGILLAFWGDLDPVRVRNIGVEGMGLHRGTITPPSPGSLLVTDGADPGPPGATLLGATPMGSTPMGATPLVTNSAASWRVFRTSSTP